MKSPAKFFQVNQALAIALSVAGYCHFGIQLVSAQTFIVDFRFDPSDPGYNPSAPNVLTLAPGQAGATYKIDIYGTAIAASPQAGADFQLQAIGLRGLDDGGNAFSTGTGLGVVAGSFAPNSPTFLTDGFTQPAVTDLGKTTDNGLTATAGGDGLLDFGGTISPQRLTFFAFPPAPGSGANVSSYTWLLGSFDYTIGQANVFSGTTHFSPTLLASVQGPGTAAQYTTTGGTIVAGPVTLSTLPLTFTVAGPPGTSVTVTPGAASASVLKGGSITLSAALSNTGSIDLSGGDYTVTASGGTNITYGAASPSTTTTPIGAGLSQGFTFSAATAPGAAGTPIGLATIAFTAADGGGGKIFNGPQTGTMQVDVGGAIADNSNAAAVYGAPLSAVVGSGGSYAGLESAIVGIQRAGGSNAAVMPFASPWLGGDAKILAGTKSASATAPGVSMSWRTRLVNTGANGPLDETHGGPGSALQSLNTTTGLISNVVNLSGLETGSPSANSTDPFVFDLTYNTALLFGHEQSLAQNKSIYMVSPFPGPDDGKSQYLNTVVLNSGNAVTNPSDPNYGAVSSWTAYALAKFGTATPTVAQLSSDMGAWGVDTGAHEVWAIVNHNGIFASAAVTAAVPTTISVTPGVASASVLKGGSLTISASLNNTGSTGLNGGDYTFTAAGGTSIAYGAASPTTTTTPIGAGLNQGFNFSATTVPGAGGTPIGIATVTFSAADGGGGKISNSPQTGTMQVNVGGAIADNSNTAAAYGAPLSAAQPGADRCGCRCRRGSAITMARSPVGPPTRWANSAP
jgi:hypothetical protein